MLTSGSWVLHVGDCHTHRGPGLCCSSSGQLPAVLDDVQQHTDDGQDETPHNRPVGGAGQRLEPCVPWDLRFLQAKIEP